MSHSELAIVQWAVSESLVPVRARSRDALVWWADDVRPLFTRSESADTEGLGRGGPSPSASSLGRASVDRLPASAETHG